MPTLPTLLTFAVAATLLIIVPGPNVIYIITRGIDQGRRAAVVSALGVEVGIGQAGVGRPFPDVVAAHPRRVCAVGRGA